MRESPSAMVSTVDEVVSVQAHTDRSVIGSFDTEFKRLHSRSCKLIKTAPIELLYANSHANRGAASVVVLLLRSAGVVEQTCGGITSNLWDDPFEWTLPETLSTSGRVLEYLGEVEATRKHAFASISEDADLLKKIATPADEIRPLVSVLLDALVRALGFQGRAMTLLATVSQGLQSDRQS